MHQVRKGNGWHFGMKMHIGVDESRGLIHSIETTPAHSAGIAMADKRPHGEESNVWGDAGIKVLIDEQNMQRDQ
jgi:IS5 family transposase